MVQQKNAGRTFLEREWITHIHFGPFLNSHYKIGKKKII